MTSTTPRPGVTPSRPPWRRGGWTLLRRSRNAKAADGSAGAPAATLAAAEMLLLIEPARRSEALALVATVDVGTISLHLARETHALLATTLKDEAAASAFQAKALARFPACAYFGGVAAKPGAPAGPEATTAAGA